jgi:dipeptidyl-peptidase-3
LGQWTPYTEKLFDLLILTFSENGTITDINALKEKSGLSGDEWDRILEFASQVIANFPPFAIAQLIVDNVQALSNLANYKSFGFTKFIPRVPQAKFSAVVENSPNAANAVPLWNEVRNRLRTNPHTFESRCYFLQLKEHIYALEPEASLFIGKRDQGQVSNYYLGEVITDDEVAAIQTAAEKIEIDILNTRYAASAASPSANLAYIVLHAVSRRMVRVTSSSWLRLQILNRKWCTPFRLRASTPN